MLMNMLITALSGLVSVGELIRFAENKNAAFRFSMAVLSPVQHCSHFLISLLIFSRYFCH
jgi:hypothetical protein